MKFVTLATLGLLIVAGVAHARGERTETEARARAESMARIGAGMKVIGDMAGGKAPFDAAAAAAAKESLVATATAMPEIFATEGAADPASEAAPAIWSDWNGFLAKVEVLRVAAEGIDTASVEGLKAGMGAVGGTCRACHSDYRK